MKEKWQSAFGQMTYGIYVLTTKTDDAVNGMIASWVTQVSHDPPLIMAALHPNRYSHDMIVKSRALGCISLIDLRKICSNGSKGRTLRKSLPEWAGHQEKPGYPF